MSPAPEVRLLQKGTQRTVGTNKCTKFGAVLQQRPKSAPHSVVKQSELQRVSLCKRRTMLVQGSFTLTSTATSCASAAACTTAALPYNASSATVRDAINSLGVSVVDVTKAVTIQHVGMAISQSPAVGTGNAFSGTSLDYSPRASGVAAEVVVGFTSSLQMTPGDVVRIALPGFTGPDRAAGQLALKAGAAGTTASDYTATWTLATRLLQLVLSSAIPKNAAQTLTVGAAPGGNHQLRLPSTALYQNDPRLTIALRNVDDAVNSIPPRPIATSCVAGCPTKDGWRFSKSALSFVSPPASPCSSPSCVPGSATPLRLSFELSTAAQAGDAVVIHLPGFTGSSAAITAWDGHPAHTYRQIAVLCVSGGLEHLTQERLGAGPWCASHPRLI